MDYYRSQRDRRAEALWADRHQDEIASLARRLLAIPDLQQRADRSTNAASANARAAELAEKPGTPLPTPVRMTWPGLLAECLKDSTDAASPTPAEQKQIHMLFGLIGHAVDPDYIGRDIRQLYRDAGPVAPPRPLRGAAERVVGLSQLLSSAAAAGSALRPAVRSSLVDGMALDPRLGLHLAVLAAAAQRREDRPVSPLGTALAIRDRHCLLDRVGRSLKEVPGGGSIGRTQRQPPSSPSLAYG
ncbi:hypothetical protein ACTPOK_10360 [Streptomyces inhibens]|uniref:hypothetical protein n=1 Tax=Streptomyces inhibens TaxID=2293571 RepID=UPI00402AEF07